VLGPALLDERDADHDHDHGEQGRGLPRITEDEVEGPGGEQEQQHRLAQDTEQRVHESALLGGGELVRSIVSKPLGRLGVGQPARCGHGSR